jgi:Family of unknown function (DUF5691)
MWQDLVKIGLIGTDKSTLSLSTLEKLQTWGISTDEMTEAVMQGIGTFSLMRKGGFLLKKQDYNHLQPSEREEKTYIPSKSVSHLREILIGKLSDALPEFIYHANLSDKIVPPEFLPHLLHYSRGNTALWTMVRTVIGKRGEWLILQNSDWTHLASVQGVFEYTAPPQYSSTQTVQLGQDILNLLKTTALWAGDRDILIKLRNLSYQGNPESIGNLDLLLNLESYHPLKNKVQETLKVLLFRREMINYLKN